MKQFLQRIDSVRIERAIRDAEARTSGEIRVVFQPGEVDDATTLAAQEFTRLEMHATRERNAVLLLVAPDARQFALYGDEGVHAKCGDRFWSDVAAAMEERLRAGAHTDAIVLGVERIGALLAREFPRQADDRDELPNDVVQHPPVI